MKQTDYHGDDVLRAIAQTIYSNESHYERHYSTLRLQLLAFVFSITSLIVGFREGIGLIYSSILLLLVAIASCYLVHRLTVVSSYHAGLVIKFRQVLARGRDKSWEKYESISGNWNKAQSERAIGYDGLWSLIALVVPLIFSIMILIQWFGA